MTWRFGHAEKPIRQQLLEARDVIIHQLEVLRNPSRVGGASKTAFRVTGASVVIDLERELGEIDAELARIEADDAEGT